MTVIGNYNLVHNGQYTINIKCKMNTIFLDWHICTSLARNIKH